MDLRKLAKAYVDAWNQQDVDKVLALMHKGAAYYDAFWMETCVGKDLSVYFRACFEIDNFYYKIVGDPVTVNGGVAYRYSVHNHGDPNEPVFYYGACVLIVRDGKILTSSEFYSSPNEADLEEICRLAERRHGLPKYAEAGLGVWKISTYRKQLSKLMDDDHIFLDKDLTLLRVAEQLGCTAEQLTYVLRSEFQMNFDKFLNQRRAKFARHLLIEESDDPDFVSRVAEMAGFRSTDEFGIAFRGLFGVSPTDFHRDREVNPDQTNRYSSN
ncbi:MAG: nuclear transport factor 2 family protein [Woeseiaceae bacterium]